MTAVVVEGTKANRARAKPKEGYRLPTDHEREAAEVTEERLQGAVRRPFPSGCLRSRLPKAGPGASRAFSVYPFTDSTSGANCSRTGNLVALGEFIRALHAMPASSLVTIQPKLEGVSDGHVHTGLFGIDVGPACQSKQYHWRRWTNKGEKVEGSTFARFALTDSRGISLSSRR